MSLPQKEASGQEPVMALGTAVVVELLRAEDAGPVVVVPPGCALSPFFFIRGRGIE